MKFTLSWLRTHLATDATLDRITDTLSAIGLEVEGVDHPGAALAPFRTARIIAARPHPNADRLRACEVDIGGEVVSVVCGAPNARTGLNVVFAPPGAFIPGTGLTIKTGEIRGVTSAGMLVSRRELALGEDHDGIIELPPTAPVGAAYADWAGLNDPVIDIGVTPNRGDALSVRGVARDLAAAGLGELKPWSPAPVPAVFDTKLTWRIDWPEACPWVLGRAIRGVRNGPSPDWLQRRLASIGLRPISALVDITNFFTFDLGRPLHVFDAEKIAGDTLALRRGENEVFAALNGRALQAGPDDLVIADATGAMSLAGIMGGAATGTGEDTTHVFLECALFDPVRIALSGRRHQLSSDARQRFERGVDQAMPPLALEAATRMILDLCGGAAGSVVEAGAEPAWRRRASLRFERIAGLGGATMDPGAASRILHDLGFTALRGDAGDDGRSITVEVPSWRNDIAGTSELDQSSRLEPARAGTAAAGAAMMEAECDLLEEVLRIPGLDAIPAISLPRGAAVPLPSLSPRQARARLAGRLLAARGLAECVSYSFVAHDQAAWFGETVPQLRLNNPIAADLDQMRPTPMASLALAAARNLARGARQAGLFEIGPGFTAAGQSLIAAGLRAGSPGRHWEDSGMPGLGVMAAKADLWALLAALGAPMEALSVTAEAPGQYHPGQSGVVRQGPRIVLARFGSLHPALLGRLGIAGPAAGFELFLDAIADPKRRKRPAPDLPPLQPVFRDFAFVMRLDVAAETILRAARSAERNLVTHAALFDVYIGAPLPDGQKSIGVEVAFQPRERSFTERDIELLCGRVIDSVVKATGASLR